MHALKIWADGCTSAWVVQHILSSILNGKMVLLEYNFSVFNKTMYKDWQKCLPNIRVRENVSKIHGIHQQGETNQSVLRFRLKVGEDTTFIRRMSKIFNWKSVKHIQIIQFTTSVIFLEHSMAISDPYLEHLPDTQWSISRTITQQSVIRI